MYISSKADPRLTRSYNRFVVLPTLKSAPAAELIAWSYANDSLESLGGDIALGRTMKPDSMSCWVEKAVRLRKFAISSKNEFIGQV